MNERTFTYPIQIAIGYPVSFFVWLLAPVWPIGIFWFFYAISGNAYTPTQHYTDYPIPAMIAAPVWLWATYMVWKGAKSRSRLKVHAGWIEDSAPILHTRLRWSDVVSVTKRSQIVGENFQLITIILRSKSRTIIFANRISDFSTLVDLVNRELHGRAVHFYLEDYTTDKFRRAVIDSL
jgi:hypothetical protein